MTGVDPSSHREAEKKCRNLDYLKESDDNTGRNKADKDTKEGGGNLDSGYHSFGCPSNECQCCHSKSQEMITTMKGHFDEFPPPGAADVQRNVRNAYPQLPNTIFDNATDKHVNSSAVSSIIAEKQRTLEDRGCNSLPDVSAFKNQQQITAVMVSNDSNFHRPDAIAKVPVTSLSSSRRSQQARDELEEKIAFCLKLGYSIDQVRTTLKKIGPNASKNDILSELNRVDSPTLDLSQISGVIANEPHELVGRGVNKAPVLIPRGPSTVQDDEQNASENLRPIVIDGSNVAMSHGHKEYFSCKGIQLAVQYFLDRGHRDITVFVPNYRKEQTRPDAPIKDQEILNQLSEERILVWTPSRNVNGRRITCYDDRFILRLAEEIEGVIVSNDNFRDLQSEKPEWKEIIEKRLLMYSFVNDRFMPPDDPLGRNGPSLDNFLRFRLSSEEKKKPECPYGKKCTYGKKCKYFHPESPLRSVTEQLDTRHKGQSNSVAKNLAKEVINDSAAGLPSPQHGAQLQNNGKREFEEQRKQELEQGRHMENMERQTSSPPGAYGVSVTLAGPHEPLQPLPNHGLPAEFHHKLSLGLPYMAPQNGGNYRPYGPYPEPQRTEGSTPVTVSLSHLAPPLHSDVRRNVVSSTNHQPFSYMPIGHHSSPPAISMQDKGYKGPHPGQHSQPMFQNMTYPAQQQIQQNFPPPLPLYPGANGASSAGNPQSNMMYHWLGYQQAMLQMQMRPPIPPESSPLTPQSIPHMQSYPYMYPGLHSQMTPGNLTPQSNLTNPRSNVEPTMYEQANRQVYSSPNPLNHHMMIPSHRSLQQCSTPHKMPTIPQNSAPQSQKSQFKDPSNPRNCVYRNLCALFNSATVEKVMLQNPNVDHPKKLAMICLQMDN